MHAGPEVRMPGHLGAIFLEWLVCLYFATDLKAMEPSDLELDARARANLSPFKLLYSRYLSQQ